LRVEYADGFGLARASNTTPVIVLRFEADDDAGLGRIKSEFRRVLLAAKPGAILPF
jgi:phosphomannomutase/phosphoglucomutase